MWIDWDSIDSHLKFMHSPSYTPFKSLLAEITTAIHLFHISPIPFPPSILGQAPCVEFATFFSAEPGFLQNMEKLISELTKNKESVDGYFGSAYGESIEEVVKWSEIGTEEEGKEGNKAKALTVLLGWESKEHHERFRETELFKENVSLLREKNRGAEIFHVKFTAV
jgi:hypothetical protein